MAAGGGALPAGAVFGALPAGAVFKPTDQELITTYSRNGYMALIGMLPFVGYMYSMRPDQIPIQGEGTIVEYEEYGLRTTSNEWLVVTYKCGGNRNPVLNGFWIRGQETVPVKNAQNQIIGNNQYIRFYEKERGAIWTAVEVTPTDNDEAQTVVCRLIKTKIVPAFSMDETDAAVTFDELMEAAFNEDDEDVDG